MVAVAGRTIPWDATKAIPAASTIGGAVMQQYIQQHPRSVGITATVILDVIGGFLGVASRVTPPTRLS